MIHTVGMSYPIDVVFLDSTGLILKVLAAIPRLRAAFCIRAAQVLELAAGEAYRLGWTVGLRLKLSLE